MNLRLVWILPVFLGACATTSNMTLPATPADVMISPRYDQTQISKVAILPMLARRPVETDLSIMNGAQPVPTPQDHIFVDQIGQTLPSGVQKTMPGWKVIPPDESMSLINTHNLAMGYKNLMADFNTIPGPQNVLAVISPDSQAFLKEFQRISGADAVLVGYYCFSAIVQARTFEIVNIQGVNFWLSLYNPTVGQVWWKSSVSRYGAGEHDLDEIIQSLTSAIGKGRITQL